MGQFCRSGLKIICLVRTLNLAGYSFTSCPGQIDFQQLWHDLNNFENIDLTSFFTRLIFNSWLDILILSATFQIGREWTILGYLSFGLSVYCAGLQNVFLLKCYIVTWISKWISKPNSENLTTWSIGWTQTWKKQRSYIM